MATNVPVWIGAILGAGAVGILLWWLIPFFLGGLLAYVLVFGGVALAYVQHRNTPRAGLRPRPDDRPSQEPRQQVGEAGGDGGIHVHHRPQQRGPAPGAPHADLLRLPHRLRRDHRRHVAPGQHGHLHAEGRDLRGDVQHRRHADETAGHAAGPDGLSPPFPEGGGRPRLQGEAQAPEGQVPHPPEQGEYGLGSRDGGLDRGRAGPAQPRHQGKRLRIADLGMAPDHVEQLEQLRQERAGPVPGHRAQEERRHHDHVRPGAQPRRVPQQHQHDREAAVRRQLLNVTQTVYSLTDTGTTTYAKRLQSHRAHGAERRRRRRVRGRRDRQGRQRRRQGRQDRLRRHGRRQRPAGPGQMAQDGGRPQAGGGDARGDQQPADAPQAVRRRASRATPRTRSCFKKFNLPAEKAKVLYRPGKEVFDKRGKPSTCQTCQGTGFVGRTAVFEVIVLDDELRKAIRTVKQLPELGMQFRGGPRCSTCRSRRCARPSPARPRSTRCSACWLPARNRTPRRRSKTRNEWNTGIGISDAQHHVPYSNRFQSGERGMISLVMLAIMAGCAVGLYLKGTLAQGVAMIFNALIAGFVAFGFFEIAAKFLVQYSPGMAPWAPMVCFLLLLVLVFALLQAVEMQISKEKIDLGLMPERIGRPVAGVVLGYLVTGLPARRGGAWPPCRASTRIRASTRAAPMPPVRRRPC